VASISSLRRTRFVAAILGSSNIKTGSHRCLTRQNATANAGTRFYIAEKQETTVETPVFPKKSGILLSIHNIRG
jgi:hypothetical protein